MRSNFAQPAGGQEGVFKHSFTPTDEELLARARAWLAAGDLLVHAAYLSEAKTTGDCWWVMSPEKQMRDSLPRRIAEALLDGLVETNEAGRAKGVTVYRKALR